MFVNRVDAGRALAEHLGHLANEDVVVLGIPRGGVVVAYEVAARLGLPLDVILVRKLGVPYQPELAMGAIGEGGIRVVDPSIVRAALIDDAALAEVERRERDELERRAEAFRGNVERLSLHGRTALVVDDGIATGSTARAACLVARKSGAERVVLATPVAPARTVEALDDVADEVVAVLAPRRLHAVGEFYADFAQTTDAEVTALIERSRREIAYRGDGDRREDETGVDKDVAVAAGAVTLPGRLALPPGATGIVVFAHGSGSSRHSPRNRRVAGELNRASLGTLLLDLLTPAEEADRSNVFDIELLAARLSHTTDWLAGAADAAGLRVGYFGSSTGAAAALWAAADRPDEIGAVVSRGGRTDLADPRLHDVRAPTLLIVGSRDEVVLELNRSTLHRLGAVGRLEVVPGAGHLFEEAGTLDAVSRLAAAWFGEHLR
jgi:putative phosphoribosyl transferase